VRDWGFAREYVEGMHLMMQHRVPDTFVLATGKNCSVRKFVEAAFGAGGMSLEWRGKGVEQQGIEARSGKVRVKVNPQFFRPAEVETLLGDAAKANAELGWAPKVPVETLARMMVEADLRRRRRGASH